MSDLPRQIPKFNFGEVVLYEVKGMIEEGIITYSFLNGNFDFCYHVRDHNGQYWHRGEYELRRKE